MDLDKENKLTTPAGEAVVTVTAQLHGAQYVQSIFLEGQSTVNYTPRIILVLFFLGKSQTWAVCDRIMERILFSS